MHSHRATNNLTIWQVWVDKVTSYILIMCGNWYATEYLKQIYCQFIRKPDLYGRCRACQNLPGSVQTVVLEVGTYSTMLPGFKKRIKMTFLTAQKKAEVYAKLYIEHYNFADYLEAAKEQGLNQDEADVVWESIDRYEDMRPSEV